TRFSRDWSSDVCSSDLTPAAGTRPPPHFCPSRSTNRWRKTVFEKLVTTSRPTGRRRHPKPAEDEIPTRPGVPVEVRTVSSSDGTRLHVEIRGRTDAPTIVLSHGVLCALRFWRHQIHQLSTEFRVVAYDQRGQIGRAH